MDYDAMKKETVKAFAKPKPGMRFHEMYSFWMYILLVSPEGIVTVRTFSGHPKNPYRETNKVITYGSIKEFQQAWTYSGSSELGYTIDYCDDLGFDRMAKEIMVTAEDIERGYVE